MPSVLRRNLQVSTGTSRRRERPRGMLLVTRPATLQAESGKQSKGVYSNSSLDCNTLTMNSVNALMTSHNIVYPNSSLECIMLGNESTPYTAFALKMVSVCGAGGFLLPHSGRSTSSIVVRFEATPSVLWHGLQCQPGRRVYNANRDEEFTMPAGTKSLQCQPGQPERNAIGHTHARFKRAGVGTNGILELKCL
jgi:hypothetical protein